MSATAAYDVPLVALYRERGLVSGDYSPRGEHLPTRCARAPVCWASLGAGFIPVEGSPASELSPPWIGSSYDVGRTVVVMENLRHYGGFDLQGDTGRGMRHLGKLAGQQLAAGRRRLFASGAYRGTDVWPRALDYASIWLGAVGVLDVGATTIGGGAGPRHVALDHVAIVQHVKCSPATPGSEQPPAMWENCGRHVLVDELAILRPLRILVLGTGDNARAFGAHVLRAPPTTVHRAETTVGRRKLAITRSAIPAPWGPVDVVVVPHPAGKGGNSGKLLELLTEVLRVTGPAGQRAGSAQSGFAAS